MSQLKRIPPSDKASKSEWLDDLSAFLKNRPAAVLESVPKHITDPDAHWDTSRFDLVTLSAPVSNYYFVAHLDTEGAVGNDGNRWSLSLQTGDDASVTINIVPGEEGKPGKIVLVNEATARTNTPSAVVVLVPCSLSGARVCDVLDVIISERRDEYVFAAGGAGGR
ncbi:hypothetical protein PENSPDRAFT_496838 [Peniophora sp. CONT]|nr:hypothetical protein PENSPDRAFT_496838 [Peniophora sp. CONT]